MSQNGGFLKKNLSQVCHKMLAILSGWFALTQVISKQQVVVKRQGNELLAYDCHQLTLFPRRISSYPKNFKILLFVARVTEDVGDLSSLALAFCCREIATESLELRIELLLFKKTPCWADFAIIGFVWQFWISAAAVCFWWKTFLEARACVLIGQWTKKKRA